ncbi:hypothetical protein Tco_0718898 [Tanacetum coccineum]
MSRNSLQQQYSISLERAGRGGVGGAWVVLLVCMGWKSMWWNGFVPAMLGRGGGMGVGFFRLGDRSNKGDCQEGGTPRLHRTIPQPHQETPLLTLQRIHLRIAQPH